VVERREHKGAETCFSRLTSAQRIQVRGRRAKKPGQILRVFGRVFRAADVCIKRIPIRLASCASAVRAWSSRCGQRAAPSSSGRRKVIAGFAVSDTGFHWQAASADHSSRRRMQTYSYAESTKFHSGILTKDFSSRERRLNSRMNLCWLPRCLALRAGSVALGCVFTACGVRFGDCYFIRDAFVFTYGWSFDSDAHVHRRVSGYDGHQKIRAFWFHRHDGAHTPLSRVCRKTNRMMIAALCGHRFSCHLAVSSALVDRGQ